MKILTLYIGIDRQTAVFKALFRSITLAGGQVVEQLVTDGVEADIAITNTVETALGLINGSAATAIVLAYLSQQEKDSATRLVARFPERLTAVSFISDEEHPALGQYLTDRIAEARQA